MPLLNAAPRLPAQRLCLSHTAGPADTCSLTCSRHLAPLLCDPLSPRRLALHAAEAAAFRFSTACLFAGIALTAALDAFIHWLMHMWPGGSAVHHAPSQLATTERSAASGSEADIELADCHACTCAASTDSMHAPDTFGGQSHNGYSCGGTAAGGTAATRQGTAPGAVRMPQPLDGLLPELWVLCGGPESDCKNSRSQTLPAHSPPPPPTQAADEVVALLQRDPHTQDLLRMGASNLVHTRGALCMRMHASMLRASADVCAPLLHGCRHRHGASHHPAQHSRGHGDVCRRNEQCQGKHCRS